MAEYLGKITLINVIDGAPGTPGAPGQNGDTGIGIKSSEVYYAISISNVAPPALEDVTLSINNQILSFSDTGSTFQIQDGILYATQNGALAALSINNQTDGSILTGLEGGWGASLPSAPAGWYLWTKTIFTYTNGDQTITYNVAQNGQDGATFYTWFKYADDDQGTNMSDSPVDKKYMGVAYNKNTEEESNNPADYVWSLIQGADGADGQDAEVYRIETNQEEILRFVSSEFYESGEHKISITPEILEIQIKKQEANGSTTIVEELSTSNLTLSVYEEGSWKLFDYTPNLDDSKQKITIDLSDKNETSEEQNSGVQHYLKLIPETILKIEYQYDNYNLIKYINIRYGMTKDQATLSIYSNGIVQAIQNTKLTFDANGLTVQNGGIKVLNNEGAPVLSADTNGNLTMTGTIYANNGEFTGKITATSGSFNGAIIASSGNIGGFSIEETKLISTDENNSIILDGENGNIIAKNIELGIGAKIQDYIELAALQVEESESESGEYKNSVRIIAPKENDSSFLVVRDKNNDKVVNMTSEGKIFIGVDNNKIILDGSKGIIRTQNFINTAGAAGWSISANNSYFNNVIVRGSIKAATLEYGEVQTIGGILMVRPSSMIKEAVSQGMGKFILTLESVVGFRVEDICLITSSSEDAEIVKYYFKTLAIDNNLKQIVVEQVESNFYDNVVQTDTTESEEEQFLATTFTNKAVVCLGDPSANENKNNIGIGINASTNDTLLKPQSISVFEFDDLEENGGYTFTPHIILGKLPDDSSVYGPAAGTYGLYAENVLLKGSLVTEALDGSDTVYSGINTIYSGENRPTSKNLWDLLKDTDETMTPDDILIWAGAQGTSKSEIEASRFFVDRNGYLYAGGGYFEGAIITKSTIKAAEIQTAIITGTGAKYNEVGDLVSTPALRIQNVAEGIHFYKNIEVDGETLETAIFKLDDELISASIPQIIFNGLTINQDGQLSLPQLTASQILNENGVNAVYENVMTYQGFDFKKNSENLGSIKNNQGIISISTSSNDVAIEINSSEVKIERNLQLEQGKEVFYGQIGHYKPTVAPDGKFIGYDLYITE